MHTNEQQYKFNCTVNAVRLKLTRTYYIHGQAGSGKVSLAKKIMAYCRSLGILTNHELS